MMDHFMKEIIDGILQFSKCFHLSRKMLVIHLFKQQKNRKTCKQSYGDKKEWV